MLSFFPEMYSDELLYSVIARYQKFSGNQDKSKSIHDLFGKSTMNYSTMLPRYLGRLTERTEQFGVKYDDLLFNRTLFPFLTVFEDEHYVHMIAEWVLTGKMGFSKSNLIKWKHSLIEPYLRICPICLKEEQETFGEGYWHRFHQIPGVLVCLKHKTVLYDSLIPLFQNHTNEFICPEETSIHLNELYKNIQIEEVEVAVQLANGIQWMLDNYDKVHSFWLKYGENYQELYISLLDKRGLALKGGEVFRQEYENDFAKYYGRMLRFLKFENQTNSNEPWQLRLLCDKNEKFQPLQHIIIMQHISNGISHFFEMVSQYELEMSTGQILSQHETNPTIMKYRNYWKQSCELTPNITQGEVFCRVFPACIWLERYDKDWIHKNSTNSKYFNWIEWDKFDIPE